MALGDLENVDRVTGHLLRCWPLARWIGRQSWHRCGGDGDWWRVAAQGKSGPFGSPRSLGSLDCPWTRILRRLYLGRGPTPPQLGKSEDCEEPCHVRGCAFEVDGREPLAGPTNEALHPRADRWGPRRIPSERLPSWGWPRQRRPWWRPGRGALGSLGTVRPSGLSHLALSNGTPCGRFLLRVPKACVH